MRFFFENHVFPTTPPTSLEEAEQRLRTFLVLVAETPLAPKPEGRVDVMFAGLQNQVQLHMHAAICAAYKAVMGEDVPSELDVRFDRDVWGNPT